LIGKNTVKLQLAENEEDYQENYVGGELMYTLMPK
jgi:hypothetical protein